MRKRGGGEDGDGEGKMRKMNEEMKRVRENSRRMISVFSRNDDTFDDRCFL